MSLGAVAHGRTSSSSADTAEAISIARSAEATTSVTSNVRVVSGD